MKRPTANYRMSRAAKTYLAFNWDRPLLAQRKKTVIEGELYAAEVLKSKNRREADNTPAQQ